MKVCDLIRSWCETETWRPIEGFEHYSVSSWGRVQGPRAMLAFADFRGYKICSLSKGKLVKTHRVHILVAKAFLGPPPFEGAIVAHGDNDRGNCRIDNLRWASALENQEDRKRHGTKVVGSRVFGSKLKEEDIPVIRARISHGDRYPSIARDYDVSVSTISLIKRGKIWQHTFGANWSTNINESYRNAVSSKR